MEWIAVRSIYHFGINTKGINVFEERVVVFEAEDSSIAHNKALEEALLYSQNNNFILHPSQTGYRQDGESLIDGYEVWSELFEADMNLDQFYKERYAKFEYHSENA